MRTGRPAFSLRTASRRSRKASAMPPRMPPPSIEGIRLRPGPKKWRSRARGAVSSPSVRVMRAFALLHSALLYSQDFHRAVPARNIIAHDFRRAHAGRAGGLCGCRGAGDRPREALEACRDFGRARRLTYDIEVPVDAVERRVKRWRGSECEAHGGGERERDDIERGERERPECRAERHEGAQRDDGRAANAMVEPAETSERVPLISDLFVDLDTCEMRDN